MKARTVTNKKERKHEMLLTFLDNAYTGNRKPKKKSAGISLRHAILLLLGTVEREERQNAR